MTRVRVADEEDGRCPWCGDESPDECGCFPDDRDDDQLALWPSPDPHDTARESRLSAGRGVETVAWL